VLTGERVVLRPFRPSDIEPMWRARLDPATWAKTTEAPYVPETLEAYRARYAEPSKDTSAQFAVEGGGGLVGRAAMFAVDDLARSGEIGLSLLPEHRGHGHARDVLRVLLGYGFRSRNLHRVHLQTLASNEPALRAYLAVGFVEEGRLRQHAWVEGTYDDVVLMGVLREEWAQTSSPSR
jgi:RimJ/RimL family protein N-acetyltransferase